MIEFELDHAQLTRQRDAAAEAIVQLSDALSTLEPSRAVVSQTLTCALSALIEVRLLELQMTHESLEARLDKLGAIQKMADGGDLAALSRAIPQSAEHTHDDREKQPTR